jgi:uncharacterized integral membrane protein (TIGR00698 family)
MTLPLGTITTRKIVFVAAAALCLMPFISSPLALFLGVIISQVIGNPFGKQVSKVTKLLLQVSVVGLGFGMNLYDAAEAGQSAIFFTVGSISGTILLGLLLGKVMSIPKKTGLLLSVGTAICGGSAIAAVSPIIEANEKEIAVSLGIVFILNALALFIFPPLGHILHLTETQFGWWAAFAIHDTSSVVGAAQQFGHHALHLATTIKLERALWIIPVSLVTAIAFKSSGKKIPIPYFILWYVIAMSINTFFPIIAPVGEVAVLIAKKGLTLTLFLIGTGMTRSAIASVGLRPLLLAVLLWVVISAGSLMVILHTIG